MPKPSTAAPAELEPITELPSDIGKPISEAEVRRHLEELSGSDSADGSDTSDTSGPGTDSDNGTPTAPSTAPAPTPTPTNSGPAAAPAEGLNRQQDDNRPRMEHEEAQPPGGPTSPATSAAAVTTTSGSPGGKRAPSTAEPADTTEPVASLEPTARPGADGSSGEAPAAPDTAPGATAAGAATQAPTEPPGTPAAAADKAVTDQQTDQATGQGTEEGQSAASTLDQPPLAGDAPEQPQSPTTAPTTRPDAPRLRRYQPPTGDAALEDTAVRRRALLSLDPQPGEGAPSSAAPHLPTSRDAVGSQPADRGSRSDSRASQPTSPSATPDSAPTRLEESAAAASLLGDLPGTSPSPESPGHQAGAHDHPGHLVPEPEGTEDPGSRQDLQASSPAASSAASTSAAAPDTTSPDTTASDVPPSPLPAAASTGTPDSATSVSPASSRASSVPSRRSRPRGSHRRETPREENRAARRPGSRAASHWAGVLVAVALLPLAWFLVHDGAVLMTGGDASVWPDSVNVRGATELVCGAAAFVAALFMAHRSSLGTYVVGGLGLFFGLPFLVAPAAVASLVGPTVERLQAHSSLGEALTSYVMADGLTGRFVLMGLLMVMVGVVSDSARRAGRRERTAPDEPDRETDD